MWHFTSSVDAFGSYCVTATSINRSKNLYAKRKELIENKLSWEREILLNSVILLHYFSYFKTTSTTANSFFLMSNITNIYPGSPFQFQWRFCFPCETPTREPMELEVISNFHHRKHNGGSNSGPFDPMLNALTTHPRVHSFFTLFVQ